MSDTPPQIRIMIVDDHAVIRTGLRMLIEQDQTMSVVAMVGTRDEALLLGSWRLFQKDSRTS
jgi:DNA-binding NarL/FixJ family response regulator